MNPEETPSRPDEPAESWTTPGSPPPAQPPQPWQAETVQRGSWQPASQPAPWQPGTAYPQAGTGYPQAGQAPASQYPTSGQPADGFPQAGRQPYQQADPPPYGQPSYGQSTYGQATQPSSAPPSYGQPASAPPPYGQPSTPSYGQPASAPPPYGQPSSPSYGQPSSAQPPYGQPSYGQPTTTWQPPAQYAPAGQPTYPQPGQSGSDQPQSWQPWQPGMEQPAVWQPPIAPRRRRTGRILLACFLALVVVAGLAVGGVVYLNGTKKPGHTTASGPGASPAPSASSAAPTKPPVDLSTLNGMLDNQSDALLASDETGFLAAVDPSATAAVAEYKRIYRNMTAMKVALFAQTSTSGADHEAGLQSYSVEVDYCLITAPCSDMQATFSLKAELKNGQVLIESFTIPVKDSKLDSPIPWLVSDLSAAVGTRVVVAASSAEAGHLASAVAAAERDATTIDPFAQWGKPDVYVIYLADTSEARTWFGSIANIEDYVSTIYPLSDYDEQLVLIMPAAADEQEAGPGGIAETMMWAMTDMATSYGVGGTPADSLTYGLDTYVQSLNHADWVSDVLSATKSYVHSGWNKKVYLTTQVQSSSWTTSGGAEGVGYLAIKRLIQRFGMTKALEFWGYVERDGDTVDLASQQAFSLSWTSVNADCVTYIEHTV